MKTSPLSVKIAPHIHKRLKLEAERRGVAINALVGWVLGEWASNLERVERAAKRQHQDLMNLMNGKIDETILASMQEAQAQTSLEEEIAKNDS